MLRSVCRPSADREKISKSSAYNKQFIDLSESSSRISVELDEFKSRVDHLDREGLDDRPLPLPRPYLKDWIQHWLVTDSSRIGSQKNAEICLFAICFLWFGINYGQIWLFYALCWISLKNEYLRGYDRLCLQEWHNMPLPVLIYF